MPSPHRTPDSRRTPRTTRAAVLTLAAALALTGLTACGDDGGDPPIIDPSTSSSATTSSAASTESAAATTSTTTTTLVPIPGPATDDDLRYTDSLLVSFEELLRQMLLQPGRSKEIIPLLTAGQLTPDLIARATSIEQDGLRRVLADPNDFSLRPADKRVEDGLVSYLTCLHDASQEWRGDEQVPTDPSNLAVIVDMKRLAEGWRVTSYRPQAPDLFLEYCQ